MLEINSKILDRVGELVLMASSPIGFRNDRYGTDSQGEGNYWNDGRRKYYIYREQEQH